MKEIQKEKSSDYIKTDSRRRNVRDTGGRHDGMRQKADSVQSESVSENDKYSSDIFAMDTYMSLTAYGAKAEDAVTAAIHEIQRLDAMFSVGNTDSDVTTANMQGSATVSDETAYLVEQFLEISRKTDGAFDITIYPVMELWGFTTKNYKVPQADELQETLKEYPMKMHR